MLTYSILRISQREITLPDFLPLPLLCGKAAFSPRERVRVTRGLESGCDEDGFHRVVDLRFGGVMWERMALLVRSVTYQNVVDG